MRQPRCVSRLQRANQEGVDANVPQAPSRVLKRAVSYLERVKRTYAERPEVYRAFLAIMHSFKEQRVDITGLVTQVYQLFEGHPNLLIGFNTFLPIGHATSKPNVTHENVNDNNNAQPPQQLPTVSVSSGW
jgi:histone deacetylase complex regulatory component SIN3